MLLTLLSYYNDIITKIPVIGGNMLEKLELNGKNILRYYGNNPKYILVQFIDENDEAGFEEEVSRIRADTDKDFAFIGIKTQEWNNELSPWKAEPVFGKESFGGEAGANLDFLKNNFHKLREICGLHKEVPLILGGYSLAGLFSLWAGYETELFDGIAAVSPSVWFDGWETYIKDRKINSCAVYLSLGDKESRTKNKRMAEVENSIKMQYNEYSKQEGLNRILEWNEGNHFKEVPMRMAKGFSWILNNI